MKYLILIGLFAAPVMAKDQLTDFNKHLMEKFERDIRADNEPRVKRESSPSRGPASVAPEAIQEEKKIDKTIRQTGHRDW